MLSIRERQILQLKSEGNTNQEVADILVVSKRTIKSSLSAIYKKLEVKNAAGAIGKAQREGMIVGKREPNQKPLVAMKLTPREGEVASFIAKGKTDKKLPITLILVLPQ